MATLEYGRALRGYGDARADYPVFGTNGPIGWHDKPLFPGKGVVVGRKGAYRGIHYSPLPCWVIDTAFYLKMRHTHEVHPLFAYYQLKTIDLDAIDSGSAIPSTSRDAFYQIPLSLPPLATQLKIASILSAYDDLIENNTRRIQILEEMAQAIYREWFVEFRFPGHEDVRMVDSALGPIPEGWEVEAFLQVGEFVNGYAFKPSDWGSDGLPIVKIRELKDGVSAATPRHPMDGLPAKYLVKSGDVLFSWSADLEAYTWPHGDAWLNQHLFKVEPRVHFSKHFLFHSLRAHMDEFRSRALGTTMRHIKRSALGQVKTVVPPRDLQIRFDQLAAPIDALRLNLAAAGRNLRQTRDLLLPRLISGEIDVSELDLGDV